MKIGIYRSCGIGDAVQLTPLFQQIRADYSAAAVTLFTSANASGVIEGCPWLDEVVSFPVDLITSRAARYGGLPIWRRIARRGGWDIFVDLEPGWTRSAAFPLVRARRKGGLQTVGRKPFRLFDEFLLQHPSGLDQNHTAARALELWSRLTSHPDRGFGYDLSFLLDAEWSLSTLPRHFVCLMPGAGNPMNTWVGKRWPFERWLRLADFLTGSGYIPVWLGSAEDHRQFAVPKSPALNLMGRLSLLESSRVIGRSAAVIGNDSGMFQVALGLKTKAVGLFGLTNPQHTGPFRNSNALVFKAGLGVVPPRALTDFTPRPEQEALDRRMPMEALDVELVAREVAAFLSAPVSTP